MRRRTEIRDRTCTHPRCRTPAHGTDGDHIQQWARGGATQDDNIGSACRHDHRLRHEGGWRVVQLANTQLVWISRLGIHYRVPPPLIIQPLPDPVPREPVPTYQPDDHDSGPSWREPTPPPVEPGRPPPPDPGEPIPF
jgi:HNH endonuclease